MTRDHAGEDEETAVGNNISICIVSRLFRSFGADTKATEKVGKENCFRPEVGSTRIISLSVGGRGGEYGR